MDKPSQWYTQARNSRYTLCRNVRFNNFKRRYTLPRNLKKSILRRWYTFIRNYWYLNSEQWYTLRRNTQSIVIHQRQPQYLNDWWIDLTEKIFVLYLRTTDRKCGSLKNRVLSKKRQQRICRRFRRAVTICEQGTLLLKVYLAYWP